MGRWRRGAGRCAAGAGSIAALRRISAVVLVAAEAGRCAAGAGSIAALRLRGVPAPGERERARRPSRVNSFPPACTAETRQFLRRGACPPEKKLLPLASERPGGRPAARPVSECKLAKMTQSFERNVVAGELAPPPQAKRIITFLPRPPRCAALSTCPPRPLPDST